VVRLSISLLPEAEPVVGTTLITTVVVEVEALAGS
jgi:hypothetical protein